MRFKFVITANEGIRGGKTIPLKKTVDNALESCPDVKKCLIIKERTELDINLTQNRDFYYEDISNDVDEYCEPEIINAEDPLFILYTSGSTGKQKVLCIHLVDI